MCRDTSERQLAKHHCTRKGAARGRVLAPAQAPRRPHTLLASSELHTRGSSSVELRMLLERLEKASRSENGASGASLSASGERRGVLAQERQSDDRRSSSAASRMDSRTCTALFE